MLAVSIFDVVDVLATHQGDLESQPSKPAQEQKQKQPLGRRLLKARAMNARPALDEGLKHVPIAIMRYARDVCQNPPSLLNTQPTAIS